MHTTAHIPTERQPRFPMLRKYSTPEADFIVLHTDKTSGTVVWVHPEAMLHKDFDHLKVGYYSIHWQWDKSTQYYGEVRLKGWDKE